MYTEEARMRLVGRTEIKEKKKGMIPHSCAPYRAQAALTLASNRAPSQKGPEPTHPMASLRPHQRITQLPPLTTHRKGQTR